MNMRISPWGEYCLFPLVFFPVECLCCYDMWGASSGLAAQFFIAKESVEAHEDADWRINSGKQGTIALILIFYAPKAFLIHVELYSNILYISKQNQKVCMNHASVLFCTCMRYSITTIATFVIYNLYCDITKVDGDRGPEMIFTAGVIK